MNTIKCKYNWNEGIVELLFSDGTTVALLCKSIEADLSIGIKSQGKLNALQGGEAVKIRCDGVKRHSARLLRHHRPFRQHNAKHALRAVQRALSRYERRADNEPCPRMSDVREMR